MSVIILEGKVEELGNSTWSQGQRHYSMIKIGGKRYNKLQISDALDNFLSVGSVVRMACKKGMGTSLLVCAIQESDGNITNLSAMIFVMAAVVMFGCVCIIGLLPLIYLYAVFGLGGAIAIVLGAAVFFAVLVSRDGLKARSALNNMPAPVLQPSA